MEEFDTKINAIKWIAVITMVIDHVGLYLLDGQEMLLFRTIGRLCLILWPYTIVWGLKRAKSVIKYLNVIAYVAVSSQIVYMLLGLNELNPIFGLLLGGIYIYSVEKGKTWHAIMCFPLLVFVPWLFFAIVLTLYYFWSSKFWQIITVSIVIILSSLPSLVTVAIQLFGVTMGFIIINYIPGVTLRINRYIWLNFYNLHLWILLCVGGLKNG